MTGKVQDSSIFRYLNFLVTVLFGVSFIKASKNSTKTSVICGLFWGADLQNLGYDEMQFDPATHPLHLGDTDKKNRQVGKEPFIGQNN